MGAREELAAIRERVDHEPCCDHSGADEHGCWDCRNTGCAHPPYVDGVAADDVPRVVLALEAVLEDHKPRTRATHTGCRECGQIWPCNTLRAIEAALTTDTKGDAR